MVLHYEVRHTDPEITAVGVPGARSGGRNGKLQASSRLSWARDARSSSSGKTAARKQSNAPNPLRDRLLSSDSLRNGVLCVDYSASKLIAYPL